MRIRRLIWYDYIEEKILIKHNVTAEEVGELFERRPRIYWYEKGTGEGEDLYNALGQTESGRHLSVFFIRKPDGSALVVSAREMNKREKKRYEKK